MTTVSIIGLDSRQARQIWTGHRLGGKATGDLLSPDEKMLAGFLSHCKRRRVRDLACCHAAQASLERSLWRRLAQISGMTQGVPARLGPNGRAVRLRPHFDFGALASRGIDAVNHVVVAAR